MAPTASNALTRHGRPFWMSGQDAGVGIRVVGVHYCASEDERLPPQQCCGYDNVGAYLSLR
jgi:hypothetical protein